MNLIIDLIIKIFQTLFEEDRKRRVPPPPGAPGQPAARPQQRRPQTLEDWLDDLFQDEGAVVQPQAAPPPPPQASPPPLPVQAHKETLQEHIRKEKQRARLQEERAKAMDQHVHDYLGDDDVAYQQNQTEHSFQLPGNNPLQQALYAHIIFGPCKARRNMGGKFKNL